MNPAPTLLSDWLTPTGFGVIVAILLVLAVIVVIADELRTRREDDFLEDERLEQSVADYHCAGHGHEYVAVDGHWLCASCGDIVRSPLNCGGLHRYETRGQSLECTVCGHRTNLPYDRESGVA